MKHYSRISVIREDLNAGHISCVSLVDYYLKNIELNKHLNAFLEVWGDEAIERAQAIDAKVKAGTAGRLAGCVIALKDVLAYKDHRVGSSSKILEGFTSIYSATVVQRLLDEDAIFIGRTNCDEFAMGASNENSAFGPVLNAADNTRVPGGSSGGSAVAVQAHMAHAALGSDTGGSIRQPAALCGVVGVKPTYGTVSRYGLVAYASSLDQMGPFSTDVRDSALVLEAISGHDPMDSTSIPQAPLSLQHVLSQGVEGLRVGRITDMPSGADPDVTARLEAAFDALKAAGATIVDVEMPSMKYALTAYYLIAPAEASSNLARYDGVRYGLRVNATDTNAMYSATRTAGFGEEVKRRIMLGTYALSAGYYDAYYGKALKVRRLISDDFARAYTKADVLLTPTSPIVAFPVGEKSDDPLAMYLCDIYTIPTNLAGHPAMSVPFGTGAHGLPVGVQILAPTLGEQVMFKVAASLERSMIAAGGAK